ncbi:hypothetical protein [Streptomyces sp. RerS4]|uniref:hypothetical protein n=1 Tax=Streptomyces sp. RerS4 TaxID=2942449 RepID=UPI00201BE0C9|nr:hypothetical protein [Streptomyces sp. RerS4]UQX02704.1 hypothetical protein M4D82_21080 [Streptomyces sp. RerS4]
MHVRVHPPDHHPRHRLDRLRQTPASSDSPGASESPLTRAQKYVQKFASCENMSTDPKDPRLPRTEFTTVGKWGVTERGVCTDRTGNGEIVFYITPDMKAFQQGYKDHTAAQLAAGNEGYGLSSRVIVGKDFAVTPTKTKTAVALVASDLRVLSCNVSFFPPDGYHREKALVEGCGLGDFVNSEDGDGSPNYEVPRDPATEGPEKPGQPATGSLGLASAGSLAELRKLVGHSVDCTKMSTEDAAVESIDYKPVVQGDPRAWGVKERAVCGNLAGAQRAHDLNWLDVVSDMRTLQTRAKAAQLADLKDDGRLLATGSKLLVGTNVAVETNSKSVRHGLYQQQFLYLNCERGFSAPAGYRLEQSLVEGCVLTNFER